MKSIRLLSKQRNGIARKLGSRAKNRLGLSTVAALCLFAGSQAAHAQNSGSVFGSVQDKTGAVVAKATITIVDSDHGVTRTTTSNNSGEFLIQQLPVGNYILTISAPTFETSVVTEIKVDADANVKEVVNLISGSASESVTVEDTSGATIDAKSATLGTLIDQKLIEDLPIDGHNVVALSALLPGVVDVNAPATFTGDTKGPTYSASGSRNTQNLMLFDGLMWNNLFYNTGINYPTPNALQEVSVLLNNYKAQYGRNAGSVFNVITKRGQNKIHGAVWDYLQNQMFNAADYISKVNPKDNINQFGFTVGGPIFRDKLYYFGAYQQLIGRLQTTGSALTPGYAERGLLPDGKTPNPCNPNGVFKGMNCASFLADSPTGKFTNPESVGGTSGNQANPSDSENMINAGYRKAGGVGVSPCLAELQSAAAYAAIPTNLNPTTGKNQPTYIPYAEVPVNCLNPVMLNVLNTFAPEPDASGFAVTKSPAPTGDKNALVRMDYILNGQHTSDARYNYIHSSANGPAGVNSSSQGVATYAILNQGAISHFGNVGWQWVMSANLLNQLRFGYKRYESTQFPLDHRTLADFGGDFLEPGLPTLPAFSFSNAFNLGSSSQGYQDHINENVELVEQLSYTKGNHNLQGGFSFLRLQYLNRSDYPGQESYSSTFTGVSLADGLLGLTNSVQAQNRLVQGGIQHNVFTYFQDDWRATSKLTLNLGVRYELPFQWFEPHGQSATFVPGQQSTVFPGATGGLAFPGDKGVLPSLVPTDFNGITPRIGFAYDVTGAGKFLIRGGYGIFFDAVNANVIGVGEPFHFLLNQQLPQGGASTPLAGLDPSTGGTLVIPGTFDPKHPVFVAPYSIFFPDPHFRTPYVEAVNFGIQYHVPHGGVFDVNYVGKFARKLTIPVDLNPAIFDCTGGYFQADPSRYCASFEKGAKGLPLAPNGRASSNATSTHERARYAPFNTGGQGIVDILSIGTSSYNALQAQYTQRGGKLLTILSSYTYSRAIDLQTNAQTTSNAVPNVFNVKSDKGPSDSNATHNFTLGWVLRFPKYTGGFAPVRGVLNNWVYSGSYLAHTGRPFSVTINNDSALSGESNQRAALIPGANPLLPSSRHRLDKVNEYFNRDAFTYPIVGTYSSLGRNSFIGPAYIMTNMTLGRDFPLASIREGMRLNFRAEGFNVFNTPNLANPNAQFSCSTTSTFVANTQGPNQTSLSCPGAGGSYPVIVKPGTPQISFANVRSTFGNNANTSTNGRKFQFALTLFY
jgi:hypothetical protein